MTETLSNEEIQDYELRVSKHPKEKREYYYEFDPNEMQKALNTIEAKNAQIKQLVEVLEFFHKKGPSSSCAGWKDGGISCDCGYKLAQRTLSTIPDVEGYRLEREVVEAAMNLGLTDSLPILKERCIALEAHREKEKVKNDA